MARSGQREDRARHLARVIPQGDIIAWRRTAPWADDGLVEQDLVLSRALVEIFTDQVLTHALAFRGGTALQKVVIMPPRRYSEDIDLVQVEVGAIGSVIDRLRTRLDPWLGAPTRERAAATATLLYRFDSEIPPTRRLRLKVEINTREHFTVFGYVMRSLAVQSRWFEGQAQIRSYDLDELLATKLRALYQRRRGRDLFDLWDAVRHGAVNSERVVEGFLAYLENGGIRISRAQFERNLAVKSRDSAFLQEVRPMLAPRIEYDAREALELVQREFIARLPGEPWRGH